MTLESLQKKVWPTVERSREKLLEVGNNHCFVMAQRFMNAMDYLRIVVLQDAAYFLTQTSDRGSHSIYQDPLFQSEEFLQYKE